MLRTERMQRADLTSIFVRVKVSFLTHTGNAFSMSPLAKSIYKHF